MAPAEIGLIHHPASHLNIDDLRGQTIKHGVPNLEQPDPLPLALARATARLLRFSLGLVQTAYLPVMTTAQVASLVMDCYQWRVISHVRYLTHS